MSGADREAGFARPAEPAERRRGALVIAAIVAVAVALAPGRSTLIGPSPAFLGAYGALLICTELLTAVLLASRALTNGVRRDATLAAAYAFSTVLIAGNVISLPSVSGMRFAAQTAPWMWIFWHAGWGLIVNLFAWNVVPPRVNASARIVPAIAAAALCAGAAIAATARLGPLLQPNGSWTPALWVWYAVAFAIDLTALAGLARRARSVSSLEMWAGVAVIAACIEIAFTTLSLVRFSVGFYAARCFSLISGVTVFASLTIDFIATARRKMKAEREGEFRAMGEALPQILWTAGPDGAIDWYNEQWFAYTGQTRDEAAGWGWQAVHHPDDFPEVMRRWPDSIASGEPFEMEFRLRRHDGAFRWFLTRGRPFRNASGRIVRWFGTNTDIDEQRRGAERSHQIARTLQKVFLPEQLPRREGVEFDAIYVPAESDSLIGGDWYDCSTLPDGRLLISIGDVAGHGLAAAVDAGRLRQILVSESLNADDPATILSRADRLLRLQTQTMATALVAFFEPDTAVLTYASAGHPTPILCVPGEDAAILPNGGAPLGTGFAGFEAQTHVVSVPADALVVFYTDGVTEIDRDVVAGEARLVEAVRDAAAQGAVSAAALLRAAHGLRTRTDDVAILVMRRANAAERTPEVVPPATTWRFHSSSAQTARESRLVLMRYIREHAAADADVFAAELIIGELLANTVEHAPGLVEVTIEWSGEHPSVAIRDAGPGLRPKRRTLPDPFAEGGRGLFLVSSLGEGMRIRRLDAGGTEITVGLPVSRAVRGGATSLPATTERHDSSLGLAGL